MSAPAIEIQTDLLIPLYGDGVEGPRSNARWQIDVAREMLSTMDTVTFGGQRYLMEKIVALFRGVLSARPSGASRRNHTMLMEQLQHLTQIARRQCPDTQSFVQRAQGLLHLLEAVL